MRLVLLSGGVGGARLARGLAAVPEVDLTVVVNVGDDDRVYGLEVSPDLDTVIYTMAGREGPHGWGLAGDSFAMMSA
ncbi:MAG TPA: 2-phospho-L-lactate transferase CofD family protein, partial [Acidimicrobiia bacterium]|nr:2-phospho-L-lactate transferase CofD family protein [Acidimicrobiia bacterium]